jgi:hypothetical protein
MFKKLIFFAAGTCLFFACKKTAEDLPTDTLFTDMPAAVTGVDFANNLEFRQDFNIYTYRNFYNGGGVAIGDVNNDSLPDIYFTANMGKNRLYLNRGNWQFEDVTELAGVGGTKQWSTGVAMADVNGDGWLDIYVCNSGDVEGDNRENELFINGGRETVDGGPGAGIPVFKEQAKEYGLADPGLSTHAAFFDYDKDGDLDMYLLNNSFRAIGSFDLRKNERNKRDSLGGHKLFRNNLVPPSNLKSAIPNPKFEDVSEAAGIYGSVIGFGLGVTVGDVDKDGWQDIYVSNDFFERDYLYMNNRDGSFREVLPQSMGSISAASMGADLADVNNDALPDLFVTEMLPEPEARLKTKTTFDNWNRYQEAESSGYHHQFTRNMLQLNRGIGGIEELGNLGAKSSSAPPNSSIPQFPNSPIPLFSEVARLARVEATDWSWGALIQDYDNDGWKDIFVANGIYQDLTDQDFLQFVASDEVKKAVISRKGVDFKKLIEYIPSEPVPNYCFAGSGDLHFTNKAKEWGLGKPGFSNGSAYADLDNDGDLDLVVNNLNSPASLYRNNGEKQLPQNRWLNVSLKGEGQNTFAVGTKLTAYWQGKVFYVEHNPIRGFESSMDYRAHFGFGDVQTLDSLIVEWYYGKTTVLSNVPTNQFLTLSEAESQANAPKSETRNPIPPIFQPVSLSLDFQHQENRYVDFDRDRLIYHMTSIEGPKIAVGDVNSDGQDDFFIGNAKDSPGALFVQAGNQFSPTNKGIWEKDKSSEDLGCTFFDADGDGDQDLYVTSGGSEFSASSSALSDRLYFNDGKGNFNKAKPVFPAGRFESTSCVAPADFDGDGDQDLFVGVRLVPGYFGVPGNGYLLQNDGKGNFKNVAPELAPAFKETGMITDALWFDADGDRDPDLAIVGEWMPITLFINENGRLTPHPSPLTSSRGWWNCLETADLDNDGDLDLVAGNHGLNSRFRATEQKPITCHVNDFDQNGSVEQILCQYNGDKSYPVALRHDLVQQMPWLKKKYLKFANYKEQTFEDIFTPEQRKNTLTLQANCLETSVLLNQGGGKFELLALPREAQLSPVYAILPGDFDGDGKPDLLLGGNLFRVKPEAGRYDASYGCFLRGRGDGRFDAVPMQESGLYIEGEVRDFAWLTIGKQRFVLVARNNMQPLVFSVEQVK